jgi:hypothetical protein
MVTNASYRILDGLLAIFECRGAIKTGKARAIKVGILWITDGFFLPKDSVVLETCVASAEDRALRGRNLSAV